MVMLLTETIVLMVVHRLTSRIHRVCRTDALPMATIINAPKAIQASFREPAIQGICDYIRPYYLPCAASTDVVWLKGLQLLVFF